MKRQRHACDLCGHHYYRRSLAEGWTAQNPGSRAGWSKTVLRVCTKCCNARAATRLLATVAIVSAQPVKAVPNSKRKAG